MLILHSIQVKNYWILECQYLYNFARARQVWDFGIIFYQDGNQCHAMWTIFFNFVYFDFEKLTRPSIMNKKVVFF